MNPDSTFMMGSAGKFITHIAALQCVGHGLIALDGSVHSILTELDSVGVLSKNEGPDASTIPYLMKPPSRRVTLRQLLSHSGGIDYESNPRMQEWRSYAGEAPKNDYHPGIVPHPEIYSTPLLYEPGEG
jgi:CubicO group peptidase (beta-lactamase class C family)